MTITWKKVSKARYWDMLEVLPPAVMGGGAFMVGEPMDHDRATGQPTFTGFKQVGQEYFEATEAVTIAEFRKVCPGVQGYSYSLGGEAI